MMGSYLRKDFSQKRQWVGGQWLICIREKEWVFCDWIKQANVGSGFKDNHKRLLFGGKLNTNDVAV